MVGGGVYVNPENRDANNLMRKSFAIKLKSIQHDINSLADFCDKYGETDWMKSEAPWIYAYFGWRGDDSNRVNNRIQIVLRQIANASEIFDYKASSKEVDESCLVNSYQA